MTIEMLFCLVCAIFSWVGAFFSIEMYRSTNRVLNTILEELEKEG
jgi:Na+/melibiose symporter-like transporter